MGPGQLPTKPQILSEDDVSATIMDQYGNQEVIPKTPQNEPILQAFRNSGPQGSAIPTPVVEPTAPPTPENTGGASGSWAPLTSEEMGAGLNVPQQSLPPPTPMPQAVVPQIQTDVKKSSETTKKSISPAANERLIASGQKQLDALDSEADAATALNSLKLKELQAQETEVNDVIANQQLKEIARNKKIDAYRQEVDNVTNKFQDMKVDPNFFGKMDTGNKILAVLGMVMSGVGAAQTGQENLALKVLDKAADQDIAAQKVNIDNAGKAVEMKRGALKDYRDIVQDERTADLAEKNRIFEATKRQLDMIMVSPTANELVKANAAKFKADIEAKQAEFRAGIEQTVQKNARDSEVKTAVGGPKGSLKEAPGDIRESITNLQGSIEGLNHIKSLMNKSPNKTGGVKGRIISLKGTLGLQSASDAELEQALVQAIAEKMLTISGKAASEKEAARLQKTLPRLSDNPEAFFAKLDAEIENQNKKLSNVYKQWDGKYELPTRLTPEPTQDDKNAKYKFRKQ